MNIGSLSNLNFKAKLMYGYYPSATDEEKAQVFNVIKNKKLKTL